VSYACCNSTVIFKRNNCIVVYLCSKTWHFVEWAGHEIGHYIPKVKAAIESILRSCHRTYSQALLTSSRTTIGKRFSYYILAW
jgi:hypothetical protein